MNERDERLRNFFGGEFNQDWDVISGETSWQGVITKFVKENPRAHVLIVLRDLRAWLQETSSEGPKGNLSPEFGCDYDPRVDGLGEREWATQIADLIEKLLMN